MPPELATRPKITRTDDPPELSVITPDPVVAEFDVAAHPHEGPPWQAYLAARHALSLPAERRSWTAHDRYAVKVLAYWLAGDARAC